MTNTKTDESINKSKLTPFEAEYLLYLACELRVSDAVGHDSQRVSYHARAWYSQSIPQ